MPRPQQIDDRLHTILRLAQLGFWEMGMQDMSFMLSDEACDILGLEAGRRHSLDALLHVTHPADRRHVRAAVDRAMRGEAPLDIEHRIVRPSGEVRHVHARGLLTQLEGQPRYFGTVQDITERVARRNEAEQNAMLLQIASRTAHFGGWAYDLASGIMTWSEEVCRIFEVPNGTTPTIGEMLGFVAPEWRVACQERIAACVRDGTPFHEDVQITTTSGRRVWVRNTGEPVRDAHDAIISLQGAVQDITESKEAQEQTARTAQRLHATLESITDAFYTLDRDWRFTYLNREAERLLQRPRAELLGKVVWDEFSPNKAQIGYCELHRAVRENVTVVYEE